MTNERKNKNELELTLEIGHNLGKVATTGGVESMCSALKALANTFDLIGYRHSHPYSYLEKQVNFPSNLRNEITREEEGTVKYVLEATNLRLAGDKNYYSGMPEEFIHHPVVYGDFKLTKYRIEPIREKVKKPVKTTVMKKNSLDYLSQNRLKKLK